MLPNAGLADPLLFAILNEPQASCGFIHCFGCTSKLSLSLLFGFYPLQVGERVPSSEAPGMQRSQFLVAPTIAALSFLFCTASSYGQAHTKGKEVSPLAKTLKPGDYAREQPEVFEMGRWLFWE